MKHQGLVGLLAVLTIGQAVADTPEDTAPYADGQIILEPITKKNCSIDVLFVVDTSASMASYTPLTKTLLSDAIVDSEKRYTDPRFALAITNGSPILYSLSSDLTSDSSLVTELINLIIPSGGIPNEPEPYAQTIQLAKDEVSWKKNAAQLIVVVGDEVPTQMQRNELYQVLNEGSQATILLNWGGAENFDAWSEAAASWNTILSKFV